MSRMSLILVLIAAFGVGGTARPAGADQGCGESGLFAMDNRPASQGCGESGLFTIDNRPVSVDLDHDGDVDPGDFQLFEACASGPAVPHSGTPTCLTADFDHDNDVDQSDFAVFQRCFSGENNPADPNCAD